MKIGILLILAGSYMIINNIRVDRMENHLNLLYSTIKQNVVTEALNNGEIKNKLQELQYQIDVLTEKER